MEVQSSKEMWMVLIHMTSFHGLGITNEISQDLCFTAVCDIFSLLRRCTLCVFKAWKLCTA